MGARYHKSDDKMIIQITHAELKMYLGEKQDERAQGTEGTEGVPIYKEQR